MSITTAASRFSKTKDDHFFSIGLIRTVYNCFCKLRLLKLGINKIIYLYSLVYTIVETFLYIT